MATQHQKRTAIRTGKIPTGQSMKLNPKERLEKASIRPSRRDTNSARIKYETEVNSIIGGKIETTASYDIFNVDGEVYLRSDGSGSPSAYGRHAPDTKVGYRGDEDADDDLRLKADRLAKELQKAVDEAGRGDQPTPHDVRLRELLEDREKTRHGSFYISSGRLEKLNSALGGLRAKAVKAAKRAEELAEEVRQEVIRELEEEKAKGP